VNITVSATGITPISATVSIIQQGPSAALSVEPAIQTVTDVPGNTLFNVIANTSWTCSSDVSWCQPTTSGSGNGTISANYQQNLTQVIRTATLEVLGSGTFPATVKVVQLPSFVSIQENPKNELQIYPNPTTGLFLISSASNEMFEMQVTILDSKGQTVLAKHCNGANSYNFDLSQAASGNYFVKVETGGKIHMLKIIVQ
jgi:hypothetical protein